MENSIDILCYTLIKKTLLSALLLYIVKQT